MGPPEMGSAFGRGHWAFETCQQRVVEPWVTDAPSEDVEIAVGLVLGIQAT